MASAGLERFQALPRLPCGSGRRTGPWSGSACAAPSKSHRFQGAGLDFDGRYLWKRKNGGGRKTAFPHAVSAAELVSSSTAVGAFLPSEILDIGSIDAGGALFSVGQWSSEAVSGSLASGVSPATLLLTVVAGLLTSLSPCTLSVLPLTIGYIGGYSPPGAVQGDSKDKKGGSSVPLGIRAVAFSFGLASTLAAIGVGAGMAGKAYGQVGTGLPLSLGVSVLAIVMGLNLLEVLLLPLPTLDLDTRKLGLPVAMQAYAAGAVFALAASPCSTPVLATLIAFVSSTGDPMQGGLLLLAYTSGYVAPLLLAATLTDALTKLMSARRYSSWISPACGALLVAGGTYTLLSRLSDL